MDHARGEGCLTTSPSLGTLFRLTLASGVAAAVELHLRRGAPLHGRDAHGRTPLMLAAMRGHVDVCRVLLQAGADAGLRDVNGDDAATLARAKGHAPVLLLLASQSPPARPDAAGAPAALQDNSEAVPVSAALSLQERDAKQLEAPIPSGLAHPVETSIAAPTSDGRAESRRASGVLDGVEASVGRGVEEDLCQARMNSEAYGGRSLRQASDAASEADQRSSAELADRLVMDEQSCHRAAQSSQAMLDRPEADQGTGVHTGLFTSVDATALQSGEEAAAVAAGVSMEERDPQQPEDPTPFGLAQVPETAIGAYTTDTQTEAHDGCLVPESAGASDGWDVDEDLAPVRLSSEPNGRGLLRPAIGAPPGNQLERASAEPARRFGMDEQASQATATAGPASPDWPNAAQQPMASASLSIARGTASTRRQVDDGSSADDGVPTMADALAIYMVPGGSCEAGWEPEAEPDLTPSGEDIAAAAAQRENEVSRHAAELPDADWADTHIDLPDMAPDWTDAFREESDGFHAVSHLVLAGLREGWVLADELDALRESLVDGEKGRRLVVALETLLGDLGILVVDEHAIDWARMDVVESDDLQASSTAHEVAAAAERLTEIWDALPDAERILLEAAASAPVLSKAAETRLFQGLSASLTNLREAVAASPVSASLLEKWADQLDAHSVFPREISEAGWGADDQDGADALDPDQDTQAGPGEKAFADVSGNAGNPAAGALAAHLRATARALLQRGAAQELLATARLTSRRVLELTEACLGRHGSRRREGLRATIRRSDRSGHELAVLRRPASRAQQLAEPAGLSEYFQRYIDARQEIVEANLKRVVWLARRYARAAVPFLDLVQEGQIGLLRAIDRFDPERGFRFGTYATWWIRQSMSRYVQDQGRTVRVPVHMLERIAKAKRASEALRAKTGVVPTPQELAAALEADVVSVERALAADLEGISFDDMGSLPDEDAALVAPLVDEATPLTALLHHDLRRLLAASLRRLDARQARIIDLRFGLTDGNPLTLEEVGQFYGVTRERIRQIEAKSLKRLPRLLPNRQFENLVP